jgi:hypothetical protein
MFSIDLEQAAKPLLLVFCLFLFGFMCIMKTMMALPHNIWIKQAPSTAPGTRLSAPIRVRSLHLKRMQGTIKFTQVGIYNGR